MDRTVDFLQLSSNVVSNTTKAKVKAKVKAKGGSSLALLINISILKRNILDFIQNLNLNLNSNGIGNELQVNDHFDALKALKAQIGDLQSTAPSFKNSQARMHHLGIIDFLNNRLEQVAHILTLFAKEHSERRKRLEIYSKTFAAATLLHQRNPNLQQDTLLIAIAPQEDEEDLDPALIQDLEAENAALLLQFESRQSDLNLVTQSIQHIATMQSTLATHLSAQAEVVDQIAVEAEEAAQDVVQGVRVLKRTEEVMGGVKWWVAWLFIVASGILLALDIWL